MRNKSWLLLVFTVSTTLLALLFLNLNAGSASRPRPVPAHNPSLTDNISGGAAALISTTTPVDFFVPGTQPNQLQDDIPTPDTCTLCHAGFSELTGQPAESEPWTGWAGSMMANAGRDPLFYAALDIANADVAGAGEWCLRCHMPRGWLNGRSTITDGSAMTAGDQEGVQCEVCHRLVDPVADPANPAEDTDILQAITATVAITTGNAAMIIDPQDFRRGPFDVVQDIGFNPHTDAEGTRQSPYHQEAALCATCHDISNPALSWDGAEYTLNAPDAPFTDTAQMFPIERTYTEWLLSDYNTPAGVYAPQFGGNKTHVSTCQDCHMRDVTGKGAIFFGSSDIAPERSDLPLHDLTGANTWVPQLLPQHPTFGPLYTGNPARLEALQLGIDRATYMLQNAADLDIALQGTQLMVTVTNNTGHKLPTGYPEGRRIWLQVAAYDAAGQVIYQSGSYDPATAELTLDADIMIYEAKQGITPSLSNTVGISAGPSFHFALNNTVVKDNRIPPRGYQFAAFAANGAPPVTNGNADSARYADGQYWDTVTYALPSGVETVVVRLLYQVASKEYIEFLRDNNPNTADPQNNGQIMYDLWAANGRNAPVLMDFATIGLDSYMPLLESAAP